MTSPTLPVDCAWRTIDADARIVAPEERRIGPRRVSARRQMSASEYRSGSTNAIARMKCSVLHCHVQYMYRLSGFLLTVIPFAPISAGTFRPTRLGSSPKRLASLRGPNVAPARRPKANGLSFQRRGRQFATRKVEHFQREIEQDLRWKSALSHDATQRDRASDTECTRQVRRNLRA